jgi:hypothetical protein
MARIGRGVLAVLAGAIVWAVLWVSFTQGAQRALPEIIKPEQPITHTGTLLAFIAVSVALSILAGFVTAAAGGKQPMAALWALAALQLTLGIIAEASYWQLTPLWYHLVFLALIVPATVYGGVVQIRRRGRRQLLFAQTMV